MAKRRKLNPNRFQQQDGKGLFSFDPVRRNLFKWGMIAGVAGGVFMFQDNLIVQIVGVFIIVAISNHHINKASRRIPRWHAALISFLGVIVALFVVVLAGTIIRAYFMVTGGNG